ncbi:hypothetical protein CspeluHIS016_0203830 [Cutaneotrichosporon spelunceum]|uniref:Spindle pole body component n=1 Tax=Cutaneotrichosporon spelunceum TaxID=1672016 RepID=A0AAD3YAY2_9TREE|nr:hypothetical protein CspeluHIS016_0203830 [Cutaneotrichosporon spelunceum]
MGLFPLGPAAPSTLTLPPLEEDAPGAERLLGTLGRQALAVPAFSLRKPRTPPDTALPLLPDIGELPPAFGNGAFPSLDVGGYAAPSGDEDVPPSPTALRKGVEEWRQAADPVAGPLRTQPITWDGSRASLLSESPTFEAFLVASEPPLALPKLRTPANVAPAPGCSVLGLLIRATLGTALSGTVRWSTRRGGFVYSNTGPRPADLEWRTAETMMDEFLAIGTAVRRLEIIVSEHSSTPLSPTHHALFHTLSTILTYVKDRLAVGVEVTFQQKDPSAPWLRRSTALAGTRELTTTLCEVMCWPIDTVKPVGLPARPASVLTHLHAHLVAHLSIATAEQQRDSVILSLAYLLSHASKPFLDLLHQWIGLSDDSHVEKYEDPETQPWTDLGITRKPLPAADGYDVRWEYTFSARRMPAFVPRDDRRTLFEAGRSLRMLREASKGLHPLCSTDWSIRASWGWGRADELPNDLRSHTRRVQREIDYWRGATSRARTISASSVGSPHSRRRTLYTPTPPSSRGPSAPSSPSKSTTRERKDADLWAVFNLPPGGHMGSKNAASLWVPAPLDELDAFVQRHSDPDEPLLPSDSPTLELYISTHLLAPLLGHAALISRSLVSLYIDDLHYLDHLDVLKAFWLGGDGGFSERVGAALFGKNQAGAGEALGLGRRARTRVRLGLSGGDPSSLQGAWGVGLGLGLSDRTKWPPGGSELAYALRTALLDDEIADLCHRGPVWENLEDRVSCAVRSLPDEAAGGQRARWLNPQTIEALDFLYLAYSPPAAIATLLPKNIMDKYQRVHNFLLRLSRVDAVLRLLYFSVLRPTPPPDGLPVKTGVDATYNRMSSQVGLPPRTKHGPLAACSEAEKTALFLRYEMSWFVTSLSRYVLDTAIGQNWDVMRRRLDKLRHRGAVVTGTDSRPMTPGAEYEVDYEDLDFELDEAGGDAEDEGAAQLGSLSQLQSAHSLVLYHNIILNRILRACLLSDKPGHQVTFKILMALLSLILDLAKTVAEVERGAITVDHAATRVSTIGQDWSDKKSVFLHALERLSLRTSTTQSFDRQAEKTSEEADLQLLLEGEGDDRVESQHAAPGSAELQELLLRLKLCGSDPRSGRLHE